MIRNSIFTLALVFGSLIAVRTNAPTQAPIRPNADQHLSTPTIHEGAKGLAGTGKLSRALLEFKLFGFASSNEVQQVLVCHW